MQEDIRATTSSFIFYSQFGAQQTAGIVLTTMMVIMAVCPSDWAYDAGIYYLPFHQSDESRQHPIPSLDKMAC
jgi:hypothetical protein